MSQESAQMVLVDPATLVIGANVRLDARLDSDFLASVKERGVLLPIVAYRDGQALTVLYGKRRTLAAVETGRTTVPVFEVAKPEDADRIIDQLEENFRRKGNTGHEEVRAFEQLAALGLSGAQIAKRTRRDRKTVDAALAVSGSTIAGAAVERWDFLDIVQASVIAEFDNDTEAVKVLVAAAKSGQFDHVAQRLRDQRDEQAAINAVLAPLTEQGLTIIDDPSHTYNSTAAPLDDLRDENGEPLTPESHKDCPGHVAYLHHEWEEAASGPNKGEDVRVLLAAFACSDYLTHKHTHRYRQQPTNKTAAQMSDTEREHARAQRRDVIDSNKAWDSAQKVRREWLATFLGRSTAPKTAASFLAASLGRADNAITQAMANGHRLYRELTGVAQGGSRRDGTLGDYAETAATNRTHMISLGLVLAAYEDSTHRNMWRHKESWAPRYLTFLAESGYVLSAVEQRACGLDSANAGEGDATQQGEEVE